MFVFALPAASPRKPAGTARVIVSGVGESTTQRHQDIHTSHAQLSATPSISSTGVGGAPSAVTPQTVVHGTITTILRDGKKETLINDVGSSVHQVCLIILICEWYFTKLFTHFKTPV